MEHLLAHRLRQARGTRSLSSFARHLGLSYTFVREMERGNRLPSDDVLVRIAERLALEPGELALMTYCDRSELLHSHLRRRGWIAPPAPALPAVELAPAANPLAKRGEASVS